MTRQDLHLRTNPKTGRRFFAGRGNSKPIIKWWKTKNGFSSRIRGRFSLEQLLNEGYVVTRDITVNNKTEITNFSPRTREEVGLD